MRAERESIVNCAAVREKRRGFISVMTERFAAREKIRNCHGAGGSGCVALPMRRH